MSTYVQFNEDNSIAACADWPAPGMVEVDFEVVRGRDGKLYEKGKVPAPSQEELNRWNRYRISNEINQLEHSSSQSLNAIMKAQLSGQEVSSEDMDNYIECEAAIKRLRSELAAVGE